MSAFFRILITSALLCAMAAPAVAAPVKAKVETGAVIGDADAGVAAFKGIPYAAPPVGPLRWRAPQPAQAWRGDRPATDFGHSCIQSSPSPNVSEDSAAATTSEDCLTLNVWAPGHAKKAPVMVWIHGGGNTNGSSADSFYDGTGFARDGIVLVSINYRLGILGFFAHPALTAEAGSEPTGNFGLMDQVAALNWVKRNVATFGGDPDNVTVFGESAGGEDVLLLLTSPMARGLFQKAISESAGHWTGLPNLARTEAAGKETAGRLGLPGDATTAQLRALPAKTLQEVGERDVAGPTVDGRLLPVQPISAFASGAAAHIPLIIGTNGNEGSLLGDNPPDPMQRLPALKDRLERARAAYGDKAKDPAAFARLLFRDQYFSAPSRFVAQKQSAASPVYLYRFDYVMSVMRTRRGGANHASELPFVFKTWPERQTSTRDNSVIQAMHACWASFAKSSAPTCGGAPDWPAYSPAADQWMEFSADGRIGPQPVVDPRVLDAMAARDVAGR